MGEISKLASGEGGVRKKLLTFLFNVYYRLSIADAQEPKPAVSGSPSNVQNIDEFRKYHNSPQQLDGIVLNCPFVYNLSFVWPRSAINISKLLDSQWYRGEWSFNWIFDVLRALPTRALRSPPGVVVFVKSNGPYVFDLSFVRPSDCWWTFDGITIIFN